MVLVPGVIWRQVTLQHSEMERGEEGDTERTNLTLAGGLFPGLVSAFDRTGSPARCNTTQGPCGLPKNHLKHPLCTPKRW